MDGCFDINNENTWGNEVFNYLDKYFYFLNEKDFDKRNFKIDSADLGQAVRELVSILSDSHLHGYHCTRLTDNEICSIIELGMSLQNRRSLFARIDEIAYDINLPPTITQRLKDQNEADNIHRANMLWFTFSLPDIKFQLGVERFFRHWGGEALYNSHEEDTEISTILSAVGTPCIIEAQVPISKLGMKESFCGKVITRYLINRGYKSGRPTDHEDFSTSAISPNDIIRISKFPEMRFKELTNCETWTPPLK